MGDGELRMQAHSVPGRGGEGLRPKCTWRSNVFMSAPHGGADGGCKPAPDPERSVRGTTNFSLADAIDLPRPISLRPAQGRNSLIGAIDRFSQRTVE